MNHSACEWVHGWSKWCMQFCLVQKPQPKHNENPQSNWAPRAFIEHWHTRPKCCQCHWWETIHTSPPTPANETCHTNGQRGRLGGADHSTRKTLKKQTKKKKNITAARVYVIHYLQSCLLCCWYYKNKGHEIAQFLKMMSEIVLNYSWRFLLKGSHIHPGKEER